VGFGAISETNLCGGKFLTFQKIVHVVPVGFEEDRAIFGLLKLGASKIYLLMDSKEDPWGQEARKYAAKVKDRLEKFVFDMNDIKEVSFDPTSFDSCDKTIKKILDSEKDASKIYLNISSSTKLAAVAFALKAIEYENTFLYYVVPEEYNLPGEGVPFSSGARRIEVFTPREESFSVIEKEILERLDNKTYSSLGELSEIVYPGENKAGRAKLSYHIRKLQNQGLVEFEPGKKIALSTIGKSKLSPPKDDAKRLLGKKSQKVLSE
jgi:hypothetical protein